MESDQKRTVRGFMCKTEWDYELADASDGARVYPSESAVRRERKCTEQCGIVEVEVSFVSLVQPEDWSDVVGQVKTPSPASE